MDKSIVGMNIKQARKQKKMKQKELAELIGRTESSIRKYEKGLIDVPNKVIGLIARTLDVSPAELLGIPTINERVKEVRQKLNLSQEEFGNRIGLSKSGISNIENGTRNVTPKHVKLICLTFGVDELWLTTGIDDSEGSSFEKMTVGENIKQIRKQKGLTQKSLGELLSVSEGMIRQYELGIRKPKIETIEKIASALGVSIFTLYGEEYQKTPLSEYSTEELLAEIKRRVGD